MIVSPFALWFIIGAVIAIYSFIDDVFIAKNKDVLLEHMKRTSPDILNQLGRDKTYKAILAIFVIFDTLFGPVALYGFYRKTRKMKQLKAEYFGK
ncbi:TPA: hypothetical protein ACIPBC_001703 [Salmonella enterica subsp. enterica serovar Saintpaul]